MKRTIQGLLLAGSLVLGGAALAQSNAQGSGQGAMQGKGMSKGGMVEHLGFKVPADERAMLERLHHVNQMEIQLGKLAQQNAQSQDVKSYGDMLVRDHTNADQQIMAYAQKKGLKLAEPKPMDEVERKAMDAQKANMEKLQVLKGMPFDSSFLASMVGDHDEVIGKLMAGKQAQVDPALTPVLRQLTQFVTQHRQQAHTLLGRIGPGASAGIGGAGDMGHGMEHDMDMDMGKGTGGAGDMDKGKMGSGEKNTVDPDTKKK